MRAGNRGAVDEAFHLIDESHAQLRDDRRTLKAVRSALLDLESATASEPGADATRVSGPGGTFIGPLAGKLGLRPATLRAWERAGLVRPRRDPQTGYRVYDESDVRDVRLAHQLRRGGYLLEQIALARSAVRPRAGDADRGRRTGDVSPRARLSRRPPAEANGSHRAGYGEPVCTISCCQASRGWAWRRQ